MAEIRCSSLTVNDKNCKLEEHGSMSDTIRIVTTAAEFITLEKEWSKLLSISPANNYFLSWEWLWTWWQVYAGPDDRLAIILVEREKEIIGIAPFYVRKTSLGGIYPVRRMMFLGTQEEGDGEVGSDYMDVIYRDGDQRGTVNILFQAIVQHDICDDIYLSKIDTSAKTYTLLQEEAESLKFFTRVSDEHVSPYIKLPLTWDDYLGELAPSMRYKIRNERRKLQKHSNVIVSRIEHVDDLPRGFDELTRLHNHRWESRGMEGAFSNARFVQFHKNIMPLMLKRGHLELVLLSENTNSKAILYNIVYNNKIYFYQSGIDTSDKKAAFGYVLHSYCIEDAIRRGLEEYDFLLKGRSDEYKSRFATDHRGLSDLYMARTWFVKQFVKARESARIAYHYVKPVLKRVHQTVKTS
jgi:CelD/BcsL family acetyltransferase involved in cellulose biosynthesis